MTDINWEEQTPRAKIAENIRRFCESNRPLLNKASKFRRDSIGHVDFVFDKPRRINMYLSDVRIMIITANEIERDSLFSYFLKKSMHHVIKIAKDNVVYSFFHIGDSKVVHVEPASLGSYAHGGSASTISEAIKVVKPSIVISLGVAFGADYSDHSLGDVLVGRQHFSYDKATKISNGKLKIKKLHVEEPDDYMLSRFRTNVPTEEKVNGIFDNEFQIILGNMVTGEFVVDSIETREMIFSPFQPFGIVGGEMEAYGIFEEIKKHKDIHCILMKGICDWGAGKNDNFTKDGEKIDRAEDSYNPKNDLQTLAMLNACKACEMFLISKEIFADLRIRGFKKGIWRNIKVLKYRVQKEKY